MPETPASTSPIDPEDAEALMALWLKAGRGAAFFCAWCAFIIPVLLIVQLRF